MKWELIAKHLDVDAVAPCAGAWIEMVRAAARHGDSGVAPCAGAWIEIGRACPPRPDSPRRPLRGGVD